MTKNKLASLILISGMALGTLGQAPTAEANRGNQKHLVAKSGAPKAAAGSATAPALSKSKQKQAKLTTAKKSASDSSLVKEVKTRVHLAMAPSIAGVIGGGAFAQFAEISNEPILWVAAATVYVGGLVTSLFSINSAVDIIGEKSDAADKAGV